MDDTRFDAHGAAAQKFRDRVFPEHGHDFARLTCGQDPAALFITCADSRISPEMITDAAPGDLFVAVTLATWCPAMARCWAVSRRSWSSRSARCACRTSSFAGTRIAVR